jgi:hypothetical protein
VVIEGTWAMWRRALLAAAVLLGVQAARGQTPPLPRPGFGPGPMMGGPTVTPIPLPPGMSPLPAVAPSPPHLNQPGVGPPPGAVVSAVPGPAGAADTLVSFDTDLTELRWGKNGWQLAAGEKVLKEFGRFESEGREVLRLVRELRLNSLGTVGAPRPIMEYWLCNGAAPRGTPLALRTLPLDPATLKAEQLQGQWCLHDGTRILFNFGEQADAARQALAVVQRYGFTQVGYVGQVAPVMLVFLANPSGVMPAPAPATFPDLHFPHLMGGNNQPNGPGTLGPYAPQPQGPVQQAGMPPGAAQPQTPQAQPPGEITPVSLPAARPPGPTGSLLPQTPQPGDRVPIDSRQLQVKRDGGDWKLSAGGRVLANFGPNEVDARLAQAALRYYGCTEQVLIGRPEPVFSYFLSNGQAPHGLVHYVQGVSFRPDSLALAQLGGSCVIWDGTQVLLSFGDRINEAQQTLQAIQQHRFDHLCSIGRGDRAMRLLVRAN